MRTSTRGLNLIKEFEGCELKAYRCPAGVWTVGFGSTKDVTKGLKITKAEAEQRLKDDVKQFEESINALVKVSLNQNQFDALVSFTYNVGIGALKTSTLLKKLNEGDYKSAAKEMLRWTKAGGFVLNGLIRRRNAEKNLFETPITKPIFYVVKKGDTLSEIAAKYNTTYQAIAKLNNIKNPDIIKIGQKLKVKG